MNQRDIEVSIAQAKLIEEIADSMQECLRSIIPETRRRASCLSIKAHALELRTRLERYLVDQETEARMTGMLQELLELPKVGPAAAVAALETLREHLAECRAAGDTIPLTKHRLLKAHNIGPAPAEAIIKFFYRKGVHVA